MAALLCQLKDNNVCVEVDAAPQQDLKQGFGRNPLSLRDHHRQTAHRTGVLVQREGETSSAVSLSPPEVDGNLTSYISPDF